MRRRRTVSIALICAGLMALCVVGIAFPLTDPRTYAWSLVDVRDVSSAQGAGAAHMPGVELTLFMLEFTPDQVQGRAACSFFSGAYQFDRTTHTLSMSSVTLQTVSPYAPMTLPCRGGSASAFDQEFVTLLNTTSRYESNGSELRIYAGEKQTVLIFQRAPLAFDKLEQQIRIWIRT